MTEDLYPRDMLRAAANAGRAGAIETVPDGKLGSATLDNPFCGDRVTIDVALGRDGRIADVRHRLKACVLCQASAAVLADHSVGQLPSEIAATGRTLVAGLKAAADHPVPGQPAFDLFAPVTRYRSRVACVMLPFETLEKAAEAAGTPG